MNYLEIISLIEKFLKNNKIKFEEVGYLNSGKERLFNLGNKNFKVKILVQNIITKIELFNVKTKSSLVILYTRNDYIDNENLHLYLIDIINFVGI